VEQQQTVKTNLVENDSSKTKEQLQNKKVSKNDTSSVTPYLLFNYFWLSLESFI